MGCWSENCGISGLEIDHNDEVLVMLLQPVDENDGNYYPTSGSFNRFHPITTLVNGIYSHYGDIDETPSSDSSYFTDWLEIGRRKYDPNVDSHLNYMSKFFWVRKDVWDFLDQIPHEFSYGDRPKTIGESIKRIRATWIEKFKEIAAIEGDALEDIIKRNIILQPGNFCGISYNYGDIYNQLRLEFQDAAENNKEEDAMNAIEAALRLAKLNQACYELRKIVVPSTMNGPQHGGYDAINMLSLFNIKKCQEYFHQTT